MIGWEKQKLAIGQDRLKEMSVSEYRKSRPWSKRRERIGALTVGLAGK